MIANLGTAKTAAIGKHKQFRPELFIKDRSFDQSEATKRSWQSPIVLARRSQFASKAFSSFHFFTDNTFEQCGAWRLSCAQRPRPWSPKMIR
jgi:hypothetical protein